MPIRTRPHLGDRVPDPDQPKGVKDRRLSLRLHLRQRRRCRWRRLFVRWSDHPAAGPLLLVPALALALLLALAVALAIPALALATADTAGGARPDPPPHLAHPRSSLGHSTPAHSIDAPGTSGSSPAAVDRRSARPFEPPDLDPPPPSGTGAGAVDPVGTWPLSPVPSVVHRFDPPDLPYGAGHRGVDLAGRPGQPVRSALPGQVTFAGRIAGRGVVVVSHGPTRTTYEPVTAAVSVGTGVAAGAVLGRLELAGSHCLPHACLHWGWLAGRAYLDPLRLVGDAGPVRLLPLTGERAADVGARSTGRRTGVVGVGAAGGMGSLARLGADAIGARAP